LLGALSKGYLELLRTAYQLLDPLAKPFHENNFNVISPAETKIISQLSSLVHEVSTHLLTPILSGPPLISSAMLKSPSSLLINSFGRTMEINEEEKFAVGVNQVSDWWAFQYRYPYSIVVDLFVVMTHDLYGKGKQCGLYINEPIPFFHIMLLFLL
jgi:hypothetical protein